MQVDRMTEDTQLQSLRGREEDRESNSNCYFYAAIVSLHLVLCINSLHWAQKYQYYVENVRIMHISFILKKIRMQQITNWHYFKFSTLYWPCTVLSCNVATDCEVKYLDMKFCHNITTVQLNFQLQIKSSNSQDNYLDYNFCII